LPAKSADIAGTTFLRSITQQAALTLQSNSDKSSKVHSSLPEIQPIRILFRFARNTSQVGCSQSNGSIN